MRKCQEEIEDVCGEEVRAGNWVGPEFSCRTWNQDREVGTRDGRGSNPAVMRKCQEEIEDVCGEEVRAGESRSGNWEDRGIGRAGK